MQNLGDVSFFLINDFGLSENETSVYLGLLEKGRATVLDLSKALNMNRTTVHVNVEYLLQKGIVSQTQEGRGKKRLIIPEPPERLKTIVEQRKIKVLKTEEKLAEMIPQMNQFMKGGREGGNVDVKYYEGKENIQLLYSEILKADEIRAYVSHEVSVLFPENVQLFPQMHNKNSNMKIWEILDFEPFPDYLTAMAKNRYFYKRLPKEFKIVDYLLYNNSVAVVDSKSQTDIVAVVVSSQNLYESSKTIFDLVWKMI